MAETYEYLNDEDKNNIIINHIRNLEYSMFNNEVSIIAIQDGGVSDSENVTRMQAENEDIKSKISALKALLS